MIIRVENTDEMISDICEYLDVVPEFLEESIIKIGNSSFDNGIFNEDLFFSQSERFIVENNSQQLDGMFLCHLTRSIDCPQVLFPLRTLLTTSNSFSSFVKENGIVFLSNDSKLQMRFHGEIVPETALYNPMSIGNKHIRLAKRLGLLGTGDFCVNGFAFAIAPDRSTDNYYQRLMRGPELLQDIDKLLSTNLSDLYCKKTKYYFALAQVPLNSVIVDANNGSSEYSFSTEKYLSRCFEFLLEWYLKDAYSLFFNPMIRMNDSSPVAVDYYIELSSI